MLSDTVEVRVRAMSAPQLTLSEISRVTVTYTT